MPNTTRKKSFDESLPAGFLLSFKKIEDDGIIGVPMLFKLKAAGKIRVTKVGSKNFVARDELVRYLDENTY